MRVRATRMGFYDNILRYMGDEFEVADPRAISKKWMEEVILPPKPSLFTKLRLSPAFKWIRRNK